MGIKPNYSELSRKYKMDRHTIKAAYSRLDEPQKKRKERPSALDPLREEIAALLSDSAVSLVKGFYGGMSMRLIRKTIGWSGGEELFLERLAKSGQLA